MGALLQPRPSTVHGATKKAPARALDQYGRNPESLTEQLRRQSDYDKDVGYGPLYHSMMADIPRLLGGSAVAWALVMTILRLSLGRGTKAKEIRDVWTLPISAADLAELCACHVRDIQRQLSELAERGVIASKQVKNGTVKYSLSLLYRDWQEVEDYAVWKRRQSVVSIEESAEEESVSDEAPTPISKEAIRVVKAQTVKPGRALLVLAGKSFAPRNSEASPRTGTNFSVRSLPHSLWFIPPTGVRPRISEKSVRGGWRDAGGIPRQLRSRRSRIAGHFIDRCRYRHHQRCACALDEQGQNARCRGQGR